MAQRLYPNKSMQSRFKPSPAEPAGTGFPHSRYPLRPCNFPPVDVYTNYSGGPALPQRAAQPSFQRGVRGSVKGGNKSTSKANHNINNAQNKSEMTPAKKKPKLAGKMLPQRVRNLVPASQDYMDLLAFERKLNVILVRKRLDAEEALKRPMRQKRRLRLYISNTFYPNAGPNKNTQNGALAYWELRVEGRLLDDGKVDPYSKIKRKFSSFFKSLVIELDKELYGPSNHLVTWHRTHATQETDGFRVKRPGSTNVRCTILLLLDHQPLQFKLDPRLGRLLGVHTETRSAIISALWLYIRNHQLQDPVENGYINCDKYLEQILGCQRMQFAEIPQRLDPLLHPPDPIVVNHVIKCGKEHRLISFCDIDVEIDDAVKCQMINFLASTTSQQQLQDLEHKIHETIQTINQAQLQRDFYLCFAQNSQIFTHRWIVSQSRDLKAMTDFVGNPEAERRSEFYYQPCITEAVSRYFAQM